jgi:L-ascorbate metabolism protein UlaG (beta-lactamase superfamily)
MKSKMKRFLLSVLVPAVILLCAGRSASFGAVAKKGDSTESGRGMLKGVVHLNDDDVRFRSADGVIVYVDPTAGPTDSLVAALGIERPDLILITHPHEDHFQPAVIRDYLKMNPKAVVAGPAEVVKLAKEKGIESMREVEPGQAYELAGVKIKTVPAYFSEGDSHPKASGWVGYVLSLDGKRFYVTGDTEPVSEMGGVNADVIFPLLYGCGGNLDLAVKMVSISKAALVVPVHHSGQKEVIQKFIGKLPAGVQAVYFMGGRLVKE